MIILEDLCPFKDEDYYPEELNPFKEKYGYPEKLNSFKEKDDYPEKLNLFKDADDYPEELNPFKDEDDYPIHLNPFQNSNSTDAEILNPEEKNVEKEIKYQFLDENNKEAVNNFNNAVWKENQNEETCM